MASPALLCEAADLFLKHNPASFCFCHETPKQELAAPQTKPRQGFKNISK